MRQKSAFLRHPRQKGQSLVETALILPVMIILIAGAVEISNILITKNRIETAARAAARFASQGGDDVQEVALNSVTSTLDLSEGVWDIWLIESQLRSDGSDVGDWNVTQIYGAITPTTAYTDIVSVIGVDCVRDPDPINVNEPGANECIRDQVLANLQKDVAGVGTPGTGDLADLRIVAVYVSHDISSILGLNAFPSLAGILSVKGLSVMRAAAETSSDATAGCLTAMPIAFDRSLRNLHRDDQYPTGSFTYPSPPPTYASFTRNFVAEDDFHELGLNAREGDIFQLTGNDDLRYVWVKWNSGIVGGNGALVNSLTWPGDTWDYTDYEDSGVPASGQHGHVVRGFVEVGNATNLDMHIPNRISPNSTASINDVGVETQLQDHIDTGRALRFIALPTGGGAPQLLPDNRPFHTIDGFAIFRLHGYSVSGNWMLVEFIGWDTSCGQS
ncbi:MAG: pilus assembly protein [Chloroflexi bacterium]|nr:pilus assembly protein [Chloroflexota bacterium]